MQRRIYAMFNVETSNEKSAYVNDGRDVWPRLLPIYLYFIVLKPNTYTTARRAKLYLSVVSNCIVRTARAVSHTTCQSEQFRLRTEPLITSKLFPHFSRVLYILPDNINTIFLFGEKKQPKKKESWLYKYEYRANFRRCKLIFHFI